MFVTLGLASISPIRPMISNLAKLIMRPPHCVCPAATSGDSAAVGSPGISSLADLPRIERSEEHTSELQSLMRISYAVFCLKKKKKNRDKNKDSDNSIKERKNTTVHIRAITDDK